MAGDHCALGASLHPAGALCTVGIRGTESEVFEGAPLDLLSHVEDLRYVVRVVRCCGKWEAGAGGAGVESVAARGRKYRCSLALAFTFKIGFMHF